MLTPASISKQLQVAGLAPATIVLAAVVQLQASSDLRGLGVTVGTTKVHDFFFSKFMMNLFFGLVQCAFEASSCSLFLRFLMFPDAGSS
jgi:hypothetical protein